MKKGKRKIVVIDEEKCNGCGECIPSCVENAIKIENGKAVLKSENLCDGLGACLGTCPTDAIKVIEKEADPFDEKAVEEEMKKKCPSTNTVGGCPSAQTRTIPSKGEAEALSNWPIQLALLPPFAPFFNNADLVIAADCTAFAYSGFNELLKGRTLIIACPKLDDLDSYIEKLTTIFSKNEIKSLTVVHMEVPCCFGLIHAVKTSIENSKKDISFETVNIGVKGNVLNF